MLSIIEAAAVIGLGVLGLKMAFDASAKLRKNHSTLEAKMIGVVPINIQGRSCARKNAEETPENIRNTLREAESYGVYSGVVYEKTALAELRKHYSEERSAAIVPSGTHNLDGIAENNTYDIWVIQ